MITRAQMPRQLRDKGGIANVTPRKKYGLGSKIKDRFRKLIPNELADVAVKAAPLVAMIPGYGPTTAALMRGIGRFDQRGSISDALKQGAATFAFGAVFSTGCSTFVVFSDELGDSSPQPIKATREIVDSKDALNIDILLQYKNCNGVQPK